MEKKNDKIIPPWWRDGLVNFAKISASIAIPIIIALYLGKYLDTKFGTAPWIFLGLTALAFIISLVSIYVSMVKYIKDLEAKSDEIGSLDTSKEVFREKEKSDKNNTDNPVNEINK